jgi:S1-C subfamily serine protease
MLALVCAALLGQPAEPRLPDAAEKVALQATVRVYNAVKSKGGSAVVIGRGGPAIYLLTSAHVVEQADRVEIHCVNPAGKDGAPRIFKEVAVVARTGAAVDDLALLRLVAGGEMPAVALCKGDGPAWKAPRAAFSLGFVDGNSPTVSLETIVKSVMLRKPGADESAHFWKCQGLPVPGRSGGPLLHPDGTLLGICSGGDGKASYYTHLDEIRRFLKRNGLRHLTD